MRELINHVLQQAINQIMDRAAACDKHLDAEVPDDVRQFWAGGATEAYACARVLKSIQRESETW